MLLLLLSLAPELPPQPASASDPATEATKTAAFHFLVRPGLLVKLMVMYVTRLCFPGRFLG
jgi:hypothetical protein